LQRATEMARAMATRYGMESEIGQASYISDRPRYLDLPGLGPQPSEMSEATSAKIDAAIRNLIEQAFERATEILQICGGEHKAAAVRLLDKETFNEADLEPVRAAVTARITQAEEARTAPPAIEAPPPHEDGPHRDFQRLQDAAKRLVSRLENWRGFRSTNS
jgi:cell division protease FtsH